MKNGIGANIDIDKRFDIWKPAKEASYRAQKVYIEDRLVDP